MPRTPVCRLPFRRCDSLVLGDAQQLPGRGQPVALARGKVAVPDPSGFTLGNVERDFKTADRGPVFVQA